MLCEQFDQKTSENCTCEQFADANHVPCCASKLVSKTVFCHSAIRARNHVVWGICSQKHCLWVVYSRKPRSVTTLHTKTYKNHVLWAMYSRKPRSVSNLLTKTTFCKHALSNFLTKTYENHILRAICSRKQGSVSNFLTKPTFIYEYFSHESNVLY